MEVGQEREWNTVLGIPGAKKGRMRTDGRTKPEAETLGNTLELAYQACVPI